MTSIPTPARAKLAKLIPRLASDHEGEVGATVAAIQRTLHGHGCDLHDLAAAVSTGPSDASEPAARSASEQAAPTGGGHARRTHAGGGESTARNDRWHRQRDQARARQRDRENNGPRWRDLTRSGALAWLDAILHELRADEPRVQINGDTADLVHRVRKRLWHTPHRGATSHEAQRLTRAIRAAWREGVRPE